MTLDSFQLQGRTAVVTGCNKGLGQGIAIALAQAGANIVGINSSAPEQTCGIVESLGRRFLDLRANLAETSGLSALVEQSLALTGKIDILVNNAGTIRRADAIDFTEKDWDDVINLNLKNVFFLSQAVARQFIRQGSGGKIINIASMLSFQGGVRVPSYTASKSGLAGLTKLLCNEWAAKGINVNGLAPGYFATNNTTALRADEARNQQILDRIPAGRWGQPGDLAGAAVFLASRAADYMHGAIVPVDGGWLAR